MNAAMANPTPNATSDLLEGEHEVVALVVEGLRNGDIAARLVVSERTVDHHSRRDPAQARREDTGRGERQSRQTRLVS
jgi:FixJ family two-component response regulator